MLSCLSGSSSSISPSLSWEESQSCQAFLWAALSAFAFFSWASAASVVGSFFWRLGFGAVEVVMASFWLAIASSFSLSDSAARFLVTSFGGAFFGTLAAFGVFLVVVTPSFECAVFVCFLALFFLSSKSEPSDAEVYFTSLVARPDLRVDMIGTKILCSFVQVRGLHASEYGRPIRKCCAGISSR